MVPRDDGSAADSKITSNLSLKIITLEGHTHPKNNNKVIWAVYGIIYERFLKNTHNFFFTHFCGYFRGMNSKKI